MKRVLAAAFVLYAISTLTSMAGMSIGAGMLALAWLAAFVYPGQLGRLGALREELKSRPSLLYFLASLCLALACAISLVVARFDPLVYFGKTSEIRFLGDLAKLWYLFWPLVLVSGLRALGTTETADSTLRWKVLRAWLVFFFVMSIVGVIQFYTGWPRAQPIPMSPHRFHTVLLFGHHLSTASIWIFPFFVALDLAFDAQGPSRIRLPRPFLWLSALLGAVVLFLTFSRTLWVALPVALLAWVALRLPRKVAVSAWIAVGLALVAVYQSPSVRERVHSSMGTSTRFELWRANLDFFRQRTLTGAGFRHNGEIAGYYLMEKSGGKDVFSGHAHNVVLDFLGGTGLLGLWSWLAWTAVVLGALWLARKRELLPFSTGLLCAWLAFLINGLTQVNFWEAKVQHQMAWVIAWSLFAFELPGARRTSRA